MSPRAFASISQKTLTDTQRRVSTCQPGPRELSDLDRSVIHRLLHEIHWLWYIHSRNRRRGNVNEVDTKNFGHEGETARGTEVALDDLELWILTVFRWFLDDLHVERTRDLQCGSYLLCNLLQPLHIRGIERERWEDQGSVSGMYACILDVLGDRMDEELTLVSNAIDIDFLSIVDKPGDNDRVLGRDGCCSRELVLQI